MTGRPRLTPQRTGVAVRHSSAQSRDSGRIADSEPGSDDFGRRYHILRLAVLVALAVAAIVVLARWVWFLRYGLDLTDESYYLTAMADASRYPASPTAFDIVWHPLYVAVRGDVFWLRTVHLLLLMTLASLTVARALRTFAAERRRGPNLLIPAIGLATASLLCMGEWLTVPNYNTLNMMGLILVSMSLIGVLPGRTWIGDWAVLGLGFALVLLAKPTSAVLLAIVLVVTLTSARRWQWRGVAHSAAAGAVALLAASLLAGSPMALAQRFLTGSRMTQELDPEGHGSGPMLRNFVVSALDILARPTAATLLLSAAVGVGVYVAAVVVSPGSRIPQWAGGAVCLAVAFGAILAAFSDRAVSQLDRRILLVSAVVGAAAALLRRRAHPSDVPGLRSAAWLLVLMPLVYTVGTNNSTWYAAPRAGFFWLLAVSVLLVATGDAPEQGTGPSPITRSVPAGGNNASSTRPKPLLPAGVSRTVHDPAGNVRRARNIGGRPRSAPHHGADRRGPSMPADVWSTPALAATGTALAAVCLTASIGQPYRQEPLTRSPTAVVVGQSGTQLLLPPITAAYAEDLRSNAIGFQPGTPLLDLTGATPGAAVLLGATAPGLAWLAGGYPGSEASAKAGLLLAPCSDLARAWVLTSPTAPRRLPPSVLAAYGAVLSRDFTMVGDTPPRSDPAPKSPAPQQVWRPTRSIESAEAACEAARGAVAPPSESG